MNRSFHSAPRSRGGRFRRGTTSTTYLALLAFLAASVLAGCATIQQEREPYTTKRDKTAKGAGVGAAAGAAAAILKGEREADEILAGAAIGAAVGGGVGFYMDRQEEKLARIPNTTVERVSPSVLLIHFDSDVLFNTDSALLDGGSRGALGEVIASLHEFKNTAIVVQGHTDSRGAEQHNQDLSERRAAAVEGELIRKGIDRARITSVGYGESYPVADNESDYGRQQNRRVDLLLKAKAR